VHLHNDRLLKALARQPVDVTPVWIMRQAGRYLPEYRALRARAGALLNLFTTPELACEITLQPVKRFPLDAAILFSDILTIPHALGLGLEFVDGEGPQLAKPVRAAADIARLGRVDPETDLGYVMETIRLTRSALAGQLPLIGFAGSPWTLAAYMVEGGSSPTHSRVKGLMFERPQSMHQLLAIVAESVTTYLNAQIAAGVDAVMLFDTWGGVLTPTDYRQFSLHYAERILDGLVRERAGRRVPFILFTKGGGAWLEEMAAIGCDALGIDWTVELRTARQRVGEQVALQGNMDPCALYAAPERIREEVGAVLQSFGAGPGHVFNLGHGVYPDIDPGHVAACVNAVHELSQALPTEVQP
jgi:uroporphyrinogen decarboxylase